MLHTHELFAFAVARRSSLAKTLVVMEASITMQTKTSLPVRPSKPDMRLILLPQVIPWLTGDIEIPSAMAPCVGSLALCLTRTTHPSWRRFDMPDFLRDIEEELRRAEELWPRIHSHFAAMAWRIARDLRVSKPAVSLEGE